MFIVTAGLQRIVHRLRCCLSWWWCHVELWSEQEGLVSRLGASCTYSCPYLKGFIFDCIHCGMEEATDGTTSTLISIKVKTLTNEVYELRVAPEIRVVELKKQIEEVLPRSIEGHAHTNRQATANFQGQAPKRWGEPAELPS